MKLGVLFAVASLMLVGAMVAIAFPIPVQATFCYSDATNFYCGDKQKDCRSNAQHDKGEHCRKV